MPNTSFLAGVDQWVGELGRLRGVVRQHVVASQLAEIVEDRNPLRVLDVGCGQGTQSLLLARSGHLVTGLDISEKLLGHFEHALAAEPAEVRARVQLIQGSGEAAPDLVAGPFDLVLCHGVLTNRLGLPARAHTPADIDRAVAPFGWRRERWYGVRVFTDHCDEPAPADAELADLLAAECEAGARDPYRQVAALLHLAYAR